MIQVGPKEGKISQGAELPFHKLTREQRKECHGPSLCSGAVPKLPLQLTTRVGRGTSFFFSPEK